MSMARLFCVPLLALAILAVPMVEFGYLGTKAVTEATTMKPDHAGFAHVDGVNIWYGIFNQRPADTAENSGRDDGLQTASIQTDAAPPKRGGTDGDTVILLHGGLGSSLDWRNQIPALVNDHRVIVIDSRGQGRSTRAGQPISYDLMMKDVIAVMDHLKIKKAAFAGWSDGGIIGLDIAIKHPERITRLFTYGANFNPDGLIPDPGGSFLTNLRIRLSSLFDEHAATVRDITAMWNSEPDFTPAELGSIHVPTMIAAGAHEEAIKPEHTRELAEMIPNAQLAILPHAGHAGLLEDPRDFNALLTGFLDKS